MRIPWRRPEPEPPLTDGQHALVDRKLELLRQASFGFTEDRLLHMQHADLEAWTGACAGELRRRVAAAAPAGIATTVLDFPKLRCVSFQCRRVSVGGADQPSTIRTRCVWPSSASMMAGALARTTPSTSTDDTPLDTPRGLLTTIA